MFKVHDKIKNKKQKILDSSTFWDMVNSSAY